ncbi:hypothetical protein CR513_09574, partial [Mucuna pruriens]
MDRTPAQHPMGLPLLPQSSIGKTSYGSYLDLVEEAREQTCIQQATCKQWAARRYNSKAEDRRRKEEEGIWEVDTQLGETVSDMRIPRTAGWHYHPEDLEHHLPQ